MATGRMVAGGWAMTLLRTRVGVSVMMNFDYQVSGSLYFKGFYGLGEEVLSLIGIVGVDIVVTGRKGMYMRISMLEGAGYLICRGR